MQHSGQVRTAGGSILQTALGVNAGQVRLRPATAQRKHLPTKRLQLSLRSLRRAHQAAAWLKASGARASNRRVSRTAAAEPAAAPAKAPAHPNAPVAQHPTRPPPPPTTPPTGQAATARTTAEQRRPEAPSGGPPPGRRRCPPPPRARRRPGRTTARPRACCGRPPARDGGEPSPPSLRRRRRPHRRWRQTESPGMPLPASSAATGGGALSGPRAWPLPEGFGKGCRTPSQSPCQVRPVEAAPPASNASRA